MATDSISSANLGDAAGPALAALSEGATAWAPSPDWQAFYIAAKAQVSLLERFSAFRALHPARLVGPGNGGLSYFASGAGPALVLLPDADRPADCFWRLIECLERRMRVIAVDYHAPASAEHLLGGLRAVLEAEQLSQAALLGFGFGGLVAQSFADAQPRCVRALSLINAPSPMQRAAKAAQRRAKANGAIWNFDQRQRAKRAFQKGLTCPSEEAGFWRGYARELFAQRWNRAQAGALLRVQAQLHAQAGPCPSNLRIPVLIIETEGVASDQQQALRRTPARFPLAERRSFAPGAGRTIEITRPRELAHWIAP